MKPVLQSPSPLYEKVKLYVLKIIEAEAWSDDRRLPSESQLVTTCKASRMTVNRALRELVAEGYIERVAGVGTFAAEAKVASHPLYIRNIAEEIVSRGNVHSCAVIKVTETRATADIAMRLAVTMGSRIFNSEILHFESELPIQFESRYVLPEFSPDYSKVDFTKITTNEYLLKISSCIEKSEQILTSEVPSRHITEALAIDSNEHCLILTRRTWVKGKIVTYSHLYHPTSRYQFESTYKP